MIETGLIIAAGMGSRLDDGSQIPKPLRKVSGLPLLKRTILSCARAGLKKVYVVVGFDQEKIIDFLDSESWPVEVDTIANPDWKKSNGISVLVAKKHIKENFILMMSDHVFDWRILERLKEAELKTVDMRLAVDYKIHKVFDMDDATKVEVKDGLIQNIGKELSSFNTVDTGVFAMTPKIFKSLEDVQAEKGDCSLSDGVKKLASSNQAGTFDIEESFWQDVDTPEALTHAEKMLVNACRKSTDGFISRNFNRYISTFISSRLVKTPLTANQATFLTTLVGMASGFFAAQGNYWHYLLGAFLFKWASILDGVDGEMSKLKLTDSKFGQWFDTLSDNLTYVVFILGTAYGVSTRPELGVPNYLPYAAVFGLIMLLVVMFGMLIFFTNSGSLLAIQDDIVKSKKKTLLSKVLGKIYFVIKRDFFATFFLFLAVFDKSHWILFLIALATNIAWISLIANRIQGVKKKSKN